MKIKIIMLIFVLNVMTFINPIEAASEGYEFKVGAFTYRVLSDSTVGVCDCDDSIIRVANIPSSVYQYNRTYKVVSILSEAFSEKNDISMIVIPPTLSSVANSSFYCIGTDAYTLENHYGPYHVYTQLYGCGLSYNAVDCEIGDNCFLYLSENSHFNENLFFTLLHIGNQAQVLPLGLPMEYQLRGNLFIPDNVTLIESGALQGTQKAVVIGKGVKKIEAEGIKNNSSVIYSTSPLPPVCESNSLACPIDTLYVPSGSIESYKSATCWKNASHIVEREYVATEAIEFGVDTLVVTDESDFKLNYSITPSNRSDNRIVWFSSNGNVATVDKFGNIHSKKAGEVDIYACADSVLSKCHIIFPEAYLDTIYFEKDTVQRYLSNIYSWEPIYVRFSPKFACYYSLESPDTEYEGSPWYHKVDDSRYRVYFKSCKSPTLYKARIIVKQYKDLEDYSNRYSSRVTPIKTFTDSIYINYYDDPEYIDSIVFNVQQPLIVELNKETTLTATGIPENAKYQKYGWYVPDNNVMMWYVNDSEGLTFTGYSEGEVTVRKYTKVGPYVSADCKIIFSNDYDAISTVDAKKQISQVQYYNLAGLQSDKPWSGINISVTIYTDGSRSVQKLVK